MISVRRYVLYFGLAACFLLILSFFREPIISKANIGPSFPSNFGFRWDQVKPRYPVKSLTPLPTAEPQQLPKVQYDFGKETPHHSEERKKRQKAVKQTFERCWKAYREHAWGQDELAPISGRANNGFGGWAATLVDNLDTLWIMGMKLEFEDAVRTAIAIDLTKCTIDTINVFETTIRHLGGFLSAYDLSGDDRLLEKAKEFGAMLIVAFDTPNHMPITRWKVMNSVKKKQVADENVLIAEIGSLTMEFTRLSMLTGDPKWYDAVERIIRLLEDQQYKTFMPGMWPVTINAKDADFTKDSLFTLSAMSDSLYEYLPKMHALLGGVDPRYKKMYEGSMEVAIERNLWRPMVPDNADILISGSIRRLHITSQITLDAEGQHLVCFAGGMFALGGKLFEIPGHVEIGKKITNGCIWTYKALPLGIMPEKFRMLPCESKTDCQWNETRWEDGVMDEHGDLGSANTVVQAKRLPKGFTDLADRRYILRPEAIESVFLLYRMTGEQRYQEAAWEMFNSIIAATKTDLAYAAIRDVSYTLKQVLENDIQRDSMESFWMAETLKYFYLIFSEPEVISLDEWVFNTEAHPFKRRLP